MVAQARTRDRARDHGGPARGGGAPTVGRVRGAAGRADGRQRRGRRARAAARGGGGRPAACREELGEAHAAAAAAARERERLSALPAERTAQHEACLVEIDALRSELLEALPLSGWRQQATDVLKRDRQLADDISAAAARTAEFNQRVAALQAKLELAERDESAQSAKAMLERMAETQRLDAHRWEERRSQLQQLREGNLLRGMATLGLMIDAAHDLSPAGEPSPLPLPRTEFYNRQSSTINRSIYTDAQYQQIQRQRASPPPPQAMPPHSEGAAALAPSGAPPPPPPPQRIVPHAPHPPPPPTTRPRSRRSRRRPRPLARRPRPTASPPLAPAAAPMAAAATAAAAAPLAAPAPPSLAPGPRAALPQILPALPHELGGALATASDGGAPRQAAQEAMSTPLRGGGPPCVGLEPAHGPAPSSPPPPSRLRRGRGGGGGARTAPREPGLASWVVARRVARRVAPAPRRRPRAAHHALAAAHARAALQGTTARLATAPSAARGRRPAAATTAVSWRARLAGGGSRPPAAWGRRRPPRRRRRPATPTRRRRASRQALAGRATDLRRATQHPRRHRRLSDGLVGV